MENILSTANHMPVKVLTADIRKGDTFAGDEPLDRPGATGWVALDDAQRILDDGFIMHGDGFVAAYEVPIRYFPDGGRSVRHFPGTNVITVHRPVS